MKSELINENQIVTIGARQLRFGLRTGVLTTEDGKNCTLRAQSAQVLAVLAAHPNRPVSKDDLFDAVWPGLSVTDDSLTQCIADIRKAIGDSKRTTLRTIPKTGYQLVVADPPQSAATRPPLPNRRIAWVGALVLLLITGFAALNPLKTGPAKLSGQTDPSIIVLPLEDLSPNGDLAHFADGMTEDLITGLSRWEE
ncbi:winged helix-turn-helix domain-containing protein [Primorskyibacter aestuariivivens]|uniref:winged helix-turn-helix domain-containing protein n=1 Tax=Primorskyibacter aestuariivivens TaxID=1888912 RepID=UPI0023007B78|nr:winged helix-turn-helix domain-containing protein [Primorskyibacter aestuariivivens]MDA7429367.1 winged helix-turn-helix domain-containing protein [Primorskyibacter aestuariivivens]